MLQKQLIKLNACTAARKWVNGKELPEAWAACERGDWMLWYAKRVGVNLRTLTAAKAECAALVLHLMKDERSRNAVEVARKYGRGEATDEELSAAAAYAYDAYDAAAAAHAAAYDAAADAAAAAADAAAYAYAAVYAAAAAADAAHAAAYAAAYAADAAAYAAHAAAYAAAASDVRQEALAKCAEIVRGIITVEILESSAMKVAYPA